MLPRHPRRAGGDDGTCRYGAYRMVGGAVTLKKGIAIKASGARAYWARGSMMIREGEP